MQSLFNVHKQTEATDESSQWLCHIIGHHFVMKRIESWHIGKMMWPVPDDKYSHVCDRCRYEEKFK